jgi:predicted PurR-regulated permease PerM
VIKDPWLRALVMVMVAIASIYLIGLVWQVAQQFADIIVLFFLAWLLAFVLEPLVAALGAWTRMPRIVAIGITYATLVILSAVGVVLLVPTLSAQVVEIARNLPTYATQMSSWALELQGTANGWLDSHNSPVRADIASVLNPQ